MHIFTPSFPFPYACACTQYAATNCLSYIRLRDLTARSPHLLNVAMTHVLMILNGEVSHSQDYGEKEVLLPLLHLFREFLIMVRAHVCDSVCTHSACERRCITCSVHVCMWVGVSSIGVENAISLKLFLSDIYLKKKLIKDGA